jgi:hypothetical protein
VTLGSRFFCARDLGCGLSGVQQAPDLQRQRQVDVVDAAARQRILDGIDQRRSGARGACPAGASRNEYSATLC